MAESNKHHYLIIPNKKLGELSEIHIINQEYTRELNLFRFVEIFRLTPDYALENLFRSKIKKAIFVKQRQPFENSEN